jgi:hypothetical protein
MGKHRRFEQPVKYPEQQDDKAEQRDQRAEFFPEPDLVIGGARRAALQGPRKPVEAVADGLMRNVFGGMRDRGRIQYPRGALCDIAVLLAGFHSALRAEQRPKFRALGDVACVFDAPHQFGKFLVLGKHQRDIARPGRRALGGKRFAGGRALQHHGFVIVRASGRGG